MTIYVGIDLVDTDEVRESLDAHGDRYLERVFTEVEASQCGRDARRLAGRFAAKEATMKVLKELDQPLPWRSIGIHARPDGGLGIDLTGVAATTARSRGFQRLSVSVTHWRSSAAAIVFADRR